MMEESNQLHEAYQFLVKKYAPDHIKRLKSQSSEADLNEAADLAKMFANVEAMAVVAPSTSENNDDVMEES